MRLALYTIIIIGTILLSFDLKQVMDLSHKETEAALEREQKRAEQAAAAQADAHSGGMPDDANHANVSPDTPAPQASMQERIQMALDNAAKAIADNPEDPANYSARAMLYMTIGDNEKALGDLDKALELDSRDLRLLNQRAYLKRNLQQFDSAIEDLNSALEVKPDDIDTKLHRGLAYMDAKKFDLAIADFTVSLEADPSLNLARRPLAQALYESGKKAEAISLLEAYLEALKDEQLRPEAETTLAEWKAAE